jgi:DNA invertase Pin-like site-specific DNA recombinase
MKIRVCYARVSNREQAIDGNALLQQLDRLKSQKVDQVYSDIGSGRSSNRTNFQKLIEDIKKDLIIELVVTRMDRLVRGLKYQIEFVLLLEKKNVILTVLDQSVDFTTASGKFNLNNLGAIAQYESDMLSERIKHGYDYYRKLKKSSRSTLGYKIVDSKIVLDNEPFLCVIEDNIQYSKADIARTVITFFFKYKSLRGCLRNLHLYFGLSKSKTHYTSRTLHFSAAGIFNFLTHPVLRGYLAYFHYDKKRETQLFPNNHPALLAEIEYAEILTILKQNKKVGGYGFVSKHPFSGFIYCQNCFFSMQISKSSNHAKTLFYEYYKCKNAIEKGCHNSKAVRVDKIKSELFKTLQSKYQQLINLAILPLEIPPDTTEIQSLRNQIQSLSLLPNNPAIDQAIANIQLQIQLLQSEQSQNKLVHSDNEDYLKALFFSTSFWETLLPHQLKEIVQRLVNRIEIKNGEVINIILNL